MFSGRTDESLGPWLWLFCGLLAIWGPMRLALEASGSLSALLYGDPAGGAAALAGRAALAGLGVGAALALVRRHPAGVGMAQAYLAGSISFALARAVGIAASSLAPSDEWLRFGGVVLHAGVWWAYLRRSRKVRRVYGRGT